MKINKIFILAGMLLSCMISVSSCSDNDDFSTGPEIAADCPQLYFGDENIQSFEFAPTDPTSTIDIPVYRTNVQDEGTYSIKVLSNQDNVYSVPETVTFAAGQHESFITVGFDITEIAKSYTFELGFEDTDVNFYKDTKKFLVYTVTRIQWNTLGVGQWLDGFWYGFWDEVTIQQRDDDRSYYRIKNPYTNELVSMYGEPTGTYTDYFIFNLANNGNVSWDGILHINTLYDGSEIKGYYPSYLSSNYAKDNALSTVTKDEDGKILYFTIAPYWYVDGLGGWGTDYPCYLAFPGVDLATEWGWEEEE